MFHRLEFTPVADPIYTPITVSIKVTLLLKSFSNFDLDTLRGHAELCHIFALTSSESGQVTNI